MAVGVIGSGTNFDAQFHARLSHLRSDGLFMRHAPEVVKPLAIEFTVLKGCRCTLKMGSCASSGCGWNRMGQMSFQLWKRPMYGQPTVMLSFPRPSCWAKTPLRFSSEVTAWVPLRPHPLMSTFVDLPADGRAGNGRCDASKKCASPNFRSKDTAGVDSIIVAAAAVGVGARGARVVCVVQDVTCRYATCP